MRRLNNNRGSILVVVLLILYVLTTQSVSFSMFDTSETSESKRYVQSTAAFWLAEAGANMYMHDPKMLDEAATRNIEYGGGTIELSRDDSHPLVRLINSVGSFRGTRRKVQLSYEANVPEVYKNSISSKGGIRFSGRKSAVIINDKARISGTVDSKPKSDLFMEDLQENADASLTSLTDMSAVPTDGTDGFKEFVKSNQDILSKYSKDQVIHVKANEDYKIDANSDLTGKKIIFVEGEGANKGNVIIEGSGMVKENQNITIISTGTVTFNQSGYQAPNSQLNVIAWSGYEETVSGPSVHRGIIYTHGTAHFDQIKDSSTTNGSVIADGGFDFGEIWSTKVFNNANVTSGGRYPPGFEKLTGSSDNRVSSKPILWREMPV